VSGSETNIAARRGLRHVQLGRAPGLKQWHGPSPTNAMTHIAIQESLDGKNVAWMEHVTDAPRLGREDQWRAFL
jgi:hypothetical protein